MKLLYFSSFHTTLEYDELTLFSEMGINWFSTGIYKDPRNPLKSHIGRKPIDKESDPALLKEFNELNPNYGYLKPVFLSQNLVDQFDAIYITHCCPYPYFLHDNWANALQKFIAHKPIFYRTYAQQDARHEADLQILRAGGVKLLRNSPTEQNIPNYAGTDAIIRCYVDENIYNGWNGDDKMVLTFNNNYSGRRFHSNILAYERIRNHMRNERFELYGAENENNPLCNGYLEWDAQKQKYRDARVYFGLGSKPASATYNILEAMLTGCPVVTWGPKLGNIWGNPNFGQTYEMPQIIENGKNGFCSDNEAATIDFIKKCLNDHDYARAIGAAGREKIIALCGKSAVRKAWSDFFKTIGFDII